LQQKVKVEELILKFYTFTKEGPNQKQFAYIKVTMDINKTNLKLNWRLTGTIGSAEESSKRQQLPNIYY
jgi:hypothetical protein